MMADGSRILDHLPAVFARSDTNGDLRRLAAGLEDLLFGDGENTELPGYERQLEMIPALFAPLQPVEGLAAERTPDRLLGWLADWLGFTPHRLLPPDRLRAVLAAIVPLNSRRGTRGYLEALLRLSFDDDLVQIVIDDTRHAGLMLGEAKIGIETRLGATPPFIFNVAVTFALARVTAMSADEALTLRQQLQALIDYAKPGHTSYGLSSNLP